MDRPRVPGKKERKRKNLGAPVAEYKPMARVVLSCVMSLFVFDACVCREKQLACWATCVA